MFSGNRNIIFIFTFLMFIISLLHAYGKINTYASHKRIDDIPICETILCFDISYMFRHAMECERPK